jgi:hypothetical protein
LQEQRGCCLTSRYPDTWALRKPDHQHLLVEPHELVDEGSQEIGTSGTLTEIENTEKKTTVDKLVRSIVPEAGSFCKGRNRARVKIRSNNEIIIIRASSMY